MKLTFTQIAFLVLIVFIAIYWAIHKINIDENGVYIPPDVEKKIDKTKHKLGINDDKPIQEKKMLVYIAPKSKIDYRKEKYIHKGLKEALNKRWFSKDPNAPMLGLKIENLKEKIYGIKLSLRAKKENFQHIARIRAKIDVDFILYKTIDKPLIKERLRYYATSYGYSDDSKYGAIGNAKANLYTKLGKKIAAILNKKEVSIFSQIETH